MTKTKQVFISYATADAQFAHRLADDLRRLGMKVWIAPESIRPGEGWVSAVERGLEESSHVVVVLTPAALESKWVKKETDVAIAQERKGQIQVIPLDVEPCKVPLLLSSYQMVSFHRDYDAGLSQLSAILGVHVAPPELVRRLRSESDEYGIQYGSEVAQILRRYEGKRIKANREDKPDQYFVHKRMLHLLDVAAARVCGERIGPFEDLDSNEEFILDIKEIKGSPYSRLKMIEVLDRIEAEEIEKAEERLITISSLKQESITSTGLPFEPEMVRIPAGKFLMGTLEEDLWAIARKYSIKRKYIAREIPRHKVFVQEFEICKYPVTNFQYQAFVRDTDREPPGHWKGDEYPEGLHNHPVVSVSWYDAGDYCKWLSKKIGKSYRLPTEAEWEKAARGTDRREFPWGNEWDVSKCNTRDGGPGITTPVDQYLPHGESCYEVADMAGNVWEWCADWLSAYPGNPFPDEGYGETYKVLRGGAWDHGQVGARCAYRNGFEPKNRVEDVGFRCVRSSE
jgi:formylglycine-generating enzyme required for sulfatase activity